LIYWGAVSSRADRIPATMASRIGQAPADYQPYLAEAVGRAAGVRQRDFGSLLATIEAVPPRARESFTLGYGVERRARPGGPWPDVAAGCRLSPALRRWCAFAVGRLVYEVCIGTDTAVPCRSALRDLEASDPVAAAWIHRGMGAATAAKWLGDPA